MICERCGNPVPEKLHTCPRCGAFQNKRYPAGAAAPAMDGRRQGRGTRDVPIIAPNGSDEVREYGDYELSRIPAGAPVLDGKNRGSRGVPPPPARKEKKPRRAGARSRGSLSKRSINWILIAITILVLGAGALVAQYLYMHNSNAGLMKTARKNVLACNEEMLALAVNTRDQYVQEERGKLLEAWRESTPQCYWETGRDFLAVGDVDTAILSYRIADILEPENYDGLMLLATAYELNVQDDLAEAVYRNIIENVMPSRSEAYTALIGLMQEQGRDAESADMMLLAYQNTDKDSFRTQRSDFIPQTPQTNLNAGRYNIAKMSDKVHLTSPEGYDIYYTMDEKAKLPEEGTLTENGTFIPEEGTLKLRAVCVSGELVSDELSVTYTFYYPAPPAPKCNLAPNTYKTLHDVSLRPGTITDENMTRAEKAYEEKYYTYYYTIDGSVPTTDSPVYDGTPIKLPAGRVTLKAICVNRFGKASSALEVGYKFNVKPLPNEEYQEKDTFGDFTLNKTQQDEFISKFGKPVKQIDTFYILHDLQARHLEYPWGYAVFMLHNNRWILVRIQMDQKITSSPRGVGFGSSESEICAVFRDYGQLPNRDGGRGLYYDYPSVGKIMVQEDGSRVIQYTLSTVASETWVLQFWMRNDRVYRILHYYQP